VNKPTALETKKEGEKDRKDVFLVESIPRVTGGGKPQKLQITKSITGGIRKEGEGKKRFSGERKSISLGKIYLRYANRQKRENTRGKLGKSPPSSYPRGTP